jgi:hypothetical protein
MECAAGVPVARRLTRRPNGGGRRSPGGSGLRR